jgi:prephenate dehydrogenase
MDTDSETRSLARQMDLFDAVLAQPGEVSAAVDVIVLAAPVRAILQLLDELPGFHSRHAVVLDLGSTKVEVMRAMAGLPDRFDPVGGHPMCGKEQSGLRHADAALFQNAPFALSALPRTSTHARSVAEQIVTAVGAAPLWLDADLHDRWTAATSHLPYLLACTLTLVQPAEAAPLVGPGLRSTARLAGSSPEMMGDVLLTNREPILAMLGRFRTEFDRLEKNLRGSDTQALVRTLAEARDSYTGLIAAVVRDRRPPQGDSS